MSDRDPDFRDATPDWAATRAYAASQLQRRAAQLVRDRTTDLAPAPMPLPKGVYTDPARFAAEREHLFVGEPIVAGLTGDLRDPGDVLVFDSAGPSILVMRGRDGVARAFLNMCTHRGAKLIEESEPWRGRAPRVTCPFHAWTFDATGRLIGQPSAASFAGCESGARNLVELPCAEHLGLIFVRPGGGAPIDAAAHLGAFADLLAMLELDRAVPIRQGVLHADANWKFALDTYGEGYHFEMLHKTTIGQTHFNDMAYFDAFGRHHRVGFPDKSYSAYAGSPAAEWPEVGYGGVHYLFPNTVIFFGSLTPGVFFTQLFRLFPDEVGKTRCQFGVYAPFGVLSEDYRAACEGAYDATATVVQTEDYRIAGHAQANLVSAPADFHVVLGRNEIALQAVQRHIAEAIGMPL